VTRRVALTPEAQTDLLRLYDHISEHGGDARALAYVERIA
jgi:plasmid stabilization system protein ParE